MPQFYQQKKGQARVRILSKDATKAYMLMMKQTGGKLTVLPEDTYIIDELLLPVLEENGIGFERLDKK